MGWLITLGILLLLGILPLGVSAIFDEDGARVRIVAGPLKIQVFPLPQKMSLFISCVINLLPNTVTNNVPKRATIINSHI